MRSMLKVLLISLVIFSFISVALGDVFITELADPNNLYKARYVELFNNGTEDVNLSDGWMLARYTNSNTYISYRFALNGVIPAGGFFVICRDYDTFVSTYGIAPDQDGVANGVVDSNGDDNILLLNPAKEIVDFYGRPGEDGSGTDHEFEDGRAERISTVTTGNPTFDSAEWDIDNDSGGGAGAQDAPEGFDPKVWFTHSALDFGLMSAKTPTETSVVVYFSHPVDSATAEIVANYSETTLGTPTTATFSANTVELSFATPMVHNTSYTLTIDNVKSLDSLQTIASGSTFTFSYFDYVGKLIISEFVYNSEGNDNEWFELYNASSESIDITGWGFRDEPTTHGQVIPNSSTDNVIAPGEYFTIYVYGSGEVADWPLQFTPNINAAINYTDTSRYDSWGLNNSSDMIFMWDSMGNLVDSIAYDESLPGTIPVEAFWGMGQTIEVVDLSLSNDDPANWQASYFYGGTPGAENVTVAPVYPSVVISEVMYHSSLDDSAQVEWVEILNTESDSVDISGWYTLDDNPTHERTAFPAGTKIGPGEYMTILNYVSSDTFTVPFTADFDISAGDITYSDSKDNALLFDANDNLVSYMYYDDGGSGEMFEHASGADGLGYSLELIDPMASNHDPLNWQASSGIGGTPGTEPLDEFPPEILMVKALNDTVVSVVFNETVDSTVAVTLTNYTINNSIGNPTAVVWMDFKVDLTVAALSHKTAYEITVENIVDLSANVIAASTTESFFYQNYEDKIVINEFQYNGEGYDNEWIELYNASTDTIDITGWMLRDEPTSHENLVIPDTCDAELAPGDYFTIYVYGDGETRGWPIKFTPDLNAAIDYSDTSKIHLWNLNNSGDFIYLWDDQGNLTDFVDYHTDRFSFPDAVRWGVGTTCELIDPAMDRNDPASWQSSYFFGGTPGALNITEAPVYDKIIINEVMYNSDGTDYEFVELYNADVDTVDIVGWWIMDDYPQHTVVPIPDTLDTELAPGDFFTILVARGSEPNFTPDFDISGITSRPGFNNDRDNITVFNTDNMMVNYMHYDDGSYGDKDFEHATDADGTGPSLILIDITKPTWDPMNWQASSEFGGTPGYENFDTNGPVIVSAEATSDTSVVVEFDENVHPAIAGNVANYSIDNSVGTPVSATVLDNIVTLVYTSIPSGDFILTVNNLIDMVGNKIADNSTANFSWIHVGIDESAIPEVFALRQNYPNPFNPVTTIQYDLPELTKVKIVIYNISGQKVRTLVDGTQEAGFYNVIWNARNDLGKQMSSGFYFYVMDADGFHKTQKMVYLK